MCHRRTTRTIAIFSALFLLVSTARSDETRYEVGLRANVLLGDGVPANDILGLGVIGRLNLRDGWFAGVALDRYNYDFERPSLIVGIPQDPGVSVIDASASNTVLSGFVGRHYGDSSQGFDWFLTAGLGVGFPDVDDTSGPTASGGTFDLTFDAKTEIQLMGTLGTSYHFTPIWSVTFAARVEHHFMDIRITDRISGSTGKVDSQSPVGAYLSINYSF
ncbi:MAG: hypothetical protein IH838_03585 [Proteobacteria bacterium]|nr:hypothetical protein [Pseudomonadota bacterium]